jgi:hypothetical protein
MTAIGSMRELPRLVSAYWTLGGTEAAAQFGEPPRAVVQQQDDEHGPLVTDPVEHQPRRAVRIE